MKRMNKRALSLLLALTLLLTSLLPAFAYDFPVENGYAYAIWDTEDGPAIEVLRYEGEEDEAFVPITLGGVALTPENFTGTVFANGNTVRSIRVEEGHPYFKTVNGALYTKDGKTLVFYPQTEAENEVTTVPDGVERLGIAFISHADCVVLPDSVTAIDTPWWYFRVNFNAVMASPGGFAESWAKEHDLPFVILGEGHKHVYFRRVVTVPSCTQAGEAILWCPCGQAQRSVSLTQWEHFFPEYYGEDETGFYRIPGEYCLDCGISFEEVYGHAPVPEYYEPLPDDPEEPDDPVYPVDPDECGCICHKFIDERSFDVSQVSAIAMLKDFLYRLQIVIWRISGTHQYCECGKRHY